MNYIGHKPKKQFCAVIHSLLMDYENGRLKARSINRANRIIEQYSTLDADFVQRTIKTYEGKFGLCVKEVLSGRRENN